MIEKKNTIIAGESSGDQHASAYVREHQKINQKLSSMLFAKNSKIS